MQNKLKNQKGYIISIVSYLVTATMLAMALSAGFLVAMGQKKVTNQVNSSQSYYIAEAGIEDAMIRLKKNPTLSPITYTLDVGQGSTQVAIPASIGASKTISSVATTKNMQRTIQASCSIANVDNVSFYYGVQVGPGGLTMGNGSRVMGNVFSAGNVSGGGTIDNDLIVSGNGKSVSGVRVKGNAMAYSCLSGATFDGSLTYVNGGQHTCTHGALTMQNEEISAQPMPIPQSQIDDWKTEAAAVRVINGNYTITNNQTESLGPVKITGTLTISNNATLNMTGTVYVVGNIILNNNAIIRLNSSYGSAGGVFITDGTINVSNGVNFYGSGQTGSYLLVISNSTSASAISIKNNTAGAVFYATNGTLSISNGVSLVEATGYRVSMSNNSTIQYSSGIVHIYFSSGTGGGWKITDWQEQ